MDNELVGGDPLHRLQWGDAAGWTVQTADEPGGWTDVGTYPEAPPLAARPFTRWLAFQTGLTFDLADDAVSWLRDLAPSRFIDPFDEPDGGGG
jgi:hypothetical protein